MHPAQSHDVATRLFVQERMPATHSMLCISRKKSTPLAFMACWVAYSSGAKVELA